MITVIAIDTPEDLDDLLSSMNESGQSPDFPFIDAQGTASIAHGTAPSGDDWLIQFEGPRDPDSGSIHCCECLEHDPIDCDSGAMWEPLYPISGIVSGEYAETLITQSVLFKVESEKPDGDSTGEIDGPTGLYEVPC